MPTNTIDSKLQLTEILDTALEAFKRRIIGLRAFSTVYESVALKGTNKVSVPYYPLATSASQTRAKRGSYKALATDTTTSAKEILVDKNKVQAINFTSEDVARQPKFDPVRHGRIKGEKLAYDIFQDVLSVVTAANFSSTTLAAVDPDTFDEQDVNELGLLCDTDDWPEVGRSLLLKPNLYRGVVGQPAIIDASQSGSTAALTQAMLPSSLLGFETYPGLNAIPDNSENLVGMGIYSSAILTAFAPIEPTPAIMDDLYDYDVVTDEDTGIVLEYKHLADGDTDEETQVIEAHYGYAVGEDAALKRIFTA